MKIALVCSSGGHFLELHALKEFWQKAERFWVTFPGPDTKNLLDEKGEKVYWAFHPTNRNLKNLIKNFRLAGSILKREKPDAVISTGAGVAVPFILRARLAGIRTVFIESLTFTRELSLTGRLVYHVSDQFLVQWPELCQHYQRARFQGQVI